MFPTNRGICSGSGIADISRVMSLTGSSFPGQPSRSCIFIGERARSGHSRALSQIGSSTSNQAARLTKWIPMHAAVHHESPFFSMGMSFLLLQVYCPRKSWGGGQFVQRPFILRCNWAAFQIFQELGMVPNFQIVQIIEYIHSTLHLRTAAQNDRN